MSNRATPADPGLAAGNNWGNPANKIGCVVDRSVNNGAFSQIAAPRAFASTGTVTYTKTRVGAGNTYTYRVKAMNGGLSLSQGKMNRPVRSPLEGLHRPPCTPVVSN